MAVQTAVAAANMTRAWLMMGWNHRSLCGSPSCLTLFFVAVVFSLWGVYSETFIRRMEYNILLAHAFTCLCMIFFSHMYIPHYASSPWLQCAQFSFLSFSQLNTSEPELIFKYNILIHIFTTNMIYSFSFDIPIVMLVYSEQKSTRVKWVWRSKVIRIYCSM